VTRAPPAPRAQHVADPILIAEVVEKETSEHDRGPKLRDYTSIPSVEEVLLVATDSMQIEHWQRAQGRWWVGEFAGEQWLRLTACQDLILSSDLYPECAPARIPEDIEASRSR
jgi:Uma2 family endonuclease